jgi:hypothetical protein
MLLDRAIEDVFRLKNKATREQILAKLPVAAVAQQCIEEGVNLKVWVETRVYFKILS